VGVTDPLQGAAGSSLSEARIGFLIDRTPRDRNLQKRSLNFLSTDMLLTNNRSVAHARERYVDTPGNTRRLQRIWIEAPEGAP